MPVFTPESLKGLINDVVFWSKHTNGKRVGKHLVVKSILQGNAGWLTHYVKTCQEGTLHKLPSNWWKRKNEYLW